MPAALAMDLVITDRQGHIEHLHLPPAPYETPRISPDGGMLAVGTDDGNDASVWVRDVAGASSIHRLATGGRNRFPVWSADGKRIAFQSNREKDLAIFSQAANGSDAPARLTTPEAGTGHVPESWSSSHLLYSVVRGESTSLWALSLADRRSSQIAGVTSTTTIAATFSPNGRWIAYHTASTSRIHTTYVRPFPPTDEVHEISHDDDGHGPVWSRDGEQLIYIPAPRRLFAVKVQFMPSFSFSPPELLPPAGLMGPGDIPRNYDILPDGARFIGREIAEDEISRAGGPQRVEVVTNLLEVIARRR
jgi:Tol biopolymer transport system component